MVHVRDQYQDIQAAGAVFVLVTMATPELAAEFHRSFRLPFDLLCDPDRMLYQAFGLELGTLWQISGPHMWLSGLRALFKTGMGRPRGNLWQMSGTFVVCPGGQISYAHYPKTSNEHPIWAEMLSAAKSCASER